VLEGLREATARMVATLRIRQLQNDMKDAEEAELRHLEDGAMAGGDGDLMCQIRAVVPAVVIRAAMTRRMAVLAWSWSA